MIPPSLLLAASKYGSKAMIGLVIGLFAVTSFLWWKHSVYQSGFDAAVAEYEKRDAETARQGQELLKLKQHEVNTINKSNQEKAYNAAKIYNDHYARILADRERMPIKPTKASCGVNAMPGSSNDTKKFNGTGARIYGNEFQEEDLRQIEQGQLVCEQLLNILVGK